MHLVRWSRVVMAQLCSRAESCVTCRSAIAEFDVGMWRSVGDSMCNLSRRGMRGCCRASQMPAAKAAQRVRSRRQTPWLIPLHSALPSARRTENCWPTAQSSHNGAAQAILSGWSSRERRPSSPAPHGLPQSEPAPARVFFGETLVEQRMMEEVLDLLGQASDSDGDEHKSEGREATARLCDGSGCDDNDCPNCRPSEGCEEQSEQTGRDGQRASTTSTGDNSGNNSGNGGATQHDHRPSATLQTYSPINSEVSFPQPLAPFDAPRSSFSSRYHDPRALITPAWIGRVNDEAASSSTLRIQPLPPSLSGSVGPLPPMFPVPALPVAPLLATSPTAAPAGAGRAVRVLNPTAFDDIKRRLRIQVASRRYRRRKKDEQRQQKARVSQLQEELAHLRLLATHAPQRSLAAMCAELAVHEQDVAALAQQLRHAAQDEFQWVRPAFAPPREGLVVSVDWTLV